MLDSQLYCQTLLTDTLFLLLFHFRSKERRLMKMSRSSYVCTGFPNTHAGHSAQLANSVDQYPCTALVFSFGSKGRSVVLLISIVCSHTHQGCLNKYTSNTQQVHMLDSQFYLNMHLCSPCVFLFAPRSFFGSSEFSVCFRVATLTR